MPYQPPRLVQRLFKHDDPDRPATPHDLSPVVSPELEEFLKGLFGFDYMGASELELAFGQGVQNSIIHMGLNRGEYVLRPISAKFKLGDERGTTKDVNLYIIAPKDVADDVGAFAAQTINQDIHPKLHKNPRLREAVQAMLDGKGVVPEKASIGILEIANNAMIFTDKDAALQTAERFAITVEPARKIAQ